MIMLLETRKKFRFMPLFFLLGLIAFQSMAQKDPVYSFQKEVMQSFEKSYDASIRLMNYDERTGRKTFTGSGVVVSADGLILTVAHVNVPGKVYLVQFPDGREVKAKGLGEITSSDAAMIQIEEEGPFPFAPIGRSANLQHGQPSIGISFAGSLRHVKPALRLGFIVKSNSGSRNRNRNRLQTTILMEPGDSGGPVFDMEGRLIALHSSINQPLDVNLEVPIDQYLLYWDAMLAGGVFTNTPDSLAIKLPTIQPELAKSSYIPFSDTTSVLLKEFGKLDIPVFAIKSQIGDSTVQAQGTLLNIGDYFSAKMIKGKSYLLSKSSIVSDAPEVFLGKKKSVIANVLYRDRDKDLVLLEIPKQKGVKEISLSNSPDSVTHASIGKFVYSPVAEGKSRVSVLGSTPFQLTGQSRAGYFGAALELKGEEVTFSMIQDNSPAQKADLKVGMKIVRINDEEITSPEEFTQFVQQRNPGDTVRVEYLTGEEKNQAKVVLARRPMVSGKHIAERFEGGKSIVRDGFKRIFTHDGRLYPEECGGPLVGLDGTFYGINIARLSRTASLTLPVDEVKSFLREAAGNIQSGNR